jgi:hypothetical protein
MFNQPAIIMSVMSVSFAKLKQNLHVNTLCNLKSFRITDNGDMENIV